MATKTKNETTNEEKSPVGDAGASGEGAQASAMNDGPPKGWTEVASDRLVYKPAECEKRPIVGILMARLELPDGPNDEPWHAYVIRCTQPTLGIDREGKVLPVNKGEEILVPETYRLADLKRAAENMGIAWEVWIKPKDQISLGGGKKMWRYQVAVNPKSGKRTAEMMFFVSGQSTAPQLPAAGSAGSGANGQAVGADVPDAPF